VPPVTHLSRAPGASCIIIRRQHGRRPGDAPRLAQSAVGVALSVELAQHTCAFRAALSRSRSPVVLSMAAARSSVVSAWASVAVNRHREILAGAGFQAFAWCAPAQNSPAGTGRYLSAGHNFRPRMRLPVIRLLADDQSQRSG
jgi:hypothetical protein